jgi:predicted acyl esterase
VWSIYGDLGHSYADNPPAFWQQANTQANAWLTSILHHKTPSQPPVTAVTTPCLSSQSLVSYTASRFQDIPNTVLSFSSTTGATTTNLNTVQPEGEQSDPIANSGCRVITNSTDPDVASWTFAPSSASTLLGSPIVSTQVTVNGVDAEIAARLWDVNPSAGTQALVARAVYRINVATTGVTIPVVFELSANAWQLACGHQLKLELTQDDAPYWRPDNEPSSLSYAGPSLRIPAVTGSSC